MAWHRNRHTDRCPPQNVRVRVRFRVRVRVRVRFRVRVLLSAFTRSQTTHTRDPSLTRTVISSLPY